MTAVLHLHIPRTGGTSVARALTAALSDREIIRSGRPGDVSAALRRGAEIGLVSGHYPWGMHELLPDHVYFIVLRDPIERVRSMYDFIRAQPAHRHHALLAELPLDSALADPSLRKKFFNGQVRQIAGYRPGQEEMTASILDRAWENLCREDVVVAFTDRIQEGLARLSARLGRPIAPYRRINRSKAGGGPPHAEVIEAIGRLNEFDIELHRRARERFQALPIVAMAAPDKGKGAWRLAGAPVWFRARRAQAESHGEVAETTGRANRREQS